MRTISIDAPPFADPDLQIGGYLTLERADGRSVWRQRLKVVTKRHNEYVLTPVDETDGFDGR